MELQEQVNELTCTNLEVRTDNQELRMEAEELTRRHAETQEANEKLAMKLQFTQGKCKALSQITVISMEELDARARKTAAPHSSLSIATGRKCSIGSLSLSVSLVSKRQGDNVFATVTRKGPSRSGSL